MCSGGPGRPGIPGFAGQPGANGRDMYVSLEPASDDQHVRVKLGNQTSDYGLPLLLRTNGGVGAAGGNGGAGGASLYREPTARGVYKFGLPNGSFLHILTRFLPFVVVRRGRSWRRRL